MPDSGLAGGAVHHLLDDSPAQLPSPESSMPPHQLVMSRIGLLLLLLHSVFLLSRQAVLAWHSVFTQKHSVLSPTTITELQLTSLHGVVLYAALSKFLPGGCLFWLCSSHFLFC